MQDGRPATTFDFNMFNNWKIVRDRQTTPLDKRFGFREGYDLKYVVVLFLNNIALKFIVSLRFVQTHLFIIDYSKLVTECFDATLIMFLLWSRA